MMIRGPILALRWSPVGPVGPLALVSLTAFLLVQSAGAQTRFTYSKGQSVSPAYEGWMPNEDGSFTLYFGYMNTNWLEEFDIPVGPDNNIEPGGPDQGQPTHFYPRRNPFLFTIRLPQDFGNKELIWTLTTHGRTEKAYASLKSDYQIDKQVISTEVGGDGGSLRDELRYNIPPELVVEGEARRTVKAGEPVPLVALAGDPDNLPPDATANCSRDTPESGRFKKWRRHRLHAQYPQPPKRMPPIFSTGLHRRLFPPADPVCGCRGSCTEVKPRPFGSVLNR